MTPESEHNIQSAFVESILWEYRNDPTFIRPLFFAVPNGAYLGGRSPATFAKLKKEGFLQGVADILYLQARGVFSCMALELKTEKRQREKGGGLSEAQREFLKAVGDGGGISTVCYGLDQAVAAFGYYMRQDPRIKTPYPGVEYVTISDLSA